MFNSFFWILLTDQMNNFLSINEETAYIFFIIFLNLENPISVQAYNNTQTLS